MWLIYSVPVGVVTGGFAGRVLRGNEYGFLGNILAAALGAIFGGSLLRMAGMNLGGAVVGILIAAAIGATIILVFVHFFTGCRAAHRRWS
jgi:uncharacterized membrane protein YeaQ/YmgE (transglycosylase-associated protein family)